MTKEQDTFSILLTSESGLEEYLTDNTGDNAFDIPGGLVEDLTEEVIRVLQDDGVTLERGDSLHIVRNHDQ